MLALATGCQGQPQPTAQRTASPSPRMETPKSKADYKKELSPEAYHILFEQGTERAFSGALWDNHRQGTYHCAACKQPLFASGAKFESGTGWPSFYTPLSKTAVAQKLDKSYGMLRTEVHCSRCGGHLGHVFNDGPEPTGLRYCINSASLDFAEQKEGKK